MSYGIRITGLQEVRKVLGQDFKPTMATALKALASEVQGEIAPYPPATEANSPSNERGRWYERGYGSKWLTKAGVHGRKTSEQLNRSWSIRPRGALAYLVGNRASYSPFVHEAARQARYHARRKWVTDEQALRAVVQSGRAKRIVVNAIVARLKRR